MHTIATKNKRLILLPSHTHATKMHDSEQRRDATIADRHDTGSRSWAVQHVHDRASGRLIRNYRTSVPYPDPSPSPGTERQSSSPKINLLNYAAGSSFFCVPLCLCVCASFPFPNGNCALAFRLCALCSRFFQAFLK